MATEGEKKGREREGMQPEQSKASPASFVQLMENVNKIPRQNILQLQRTRLFDYTSGAS